MSIRRQSESRHVARSGPAGRRVGCVGSRGVGVGVKVNRVSSTSWTSSASKNTFHWRVRGDANGTLLYRLQAVPFIRCSCDVITTASRACTLQNDGRGHIKVYTFHGRTSSDKNLL